MDRVWALTESGLDGLHPAEFYQRAVWLLNSADLAIYADAFDRADDYINRAVVWTEQIEANEEGAWMRSAVLNARADLALARFDATGDPALAEAALADYESADAAFGSPFFGENHIRALSHLARCEEASAAIDARLAALDTEEVNSFCQEPENGITVDVWRLQLSRCRLMRLGNREGAAEACTELEAMVERSCTQSFWEPDGDRMRLYEPLPEPLACFAEN